MAITDHTSDGRIDIKAYVRAIIEPKRRIEKTESLLKQKLNYTLLFVAGQPVPPERQRLKTHVKHTKIN